MAMRPVRSTRRSELLLLLAVAQASLIYSLEPVFATLLAVLFIGERMGPAALVGGVLMFTASAIS